MDEPRFTKIKKYQIHITYSDGTCDSITSGTESLDIVDIFEPISENISVSSSSITVIKSIMRKNKNINLK